MPNEKSTLTMEEIEENGQREQSHQYWKYVIYPDSAPTLWRDMLDRYGRPWLESPLHTPEGEKPHWHIIVDHGKKTVYDRACKLCAILSCPHPRFVQYLTRDVRYLAHIDSPKKQQFDLSEEPIISHNGFDLERHLTGKKASNMVTMRQVRQFADEQGCVDFYELVAAVLDVEEDEMFSFIRKNAYMVNSFLRSREHHRMAKVIDGRRVLIDENGVVLNEDDLDLPPDVKLEV